MLTNKAGRLILIAALCLAVQACSTLRIHYEKPSISEYDKNGYVINVKKFSNAESPDQPERVRYNVTLDDDAGRVLSEAITYELLLRGYNIGESTNSIEGSLYGFFLDGGTVNYTIRNGRNTLARSQVDVEAVNTSSIFDETGVKKDFSLLAKKIVDKIDAVKDEGRFASLERKDGGMSASAGRPEKGIIGNSRQDIASDVESPPDAKTKISPLNYAIVIGIESYRQKLPRADFAANDARLVAKYLTSSLGYSEENVVVLTNENATKSDLEKYLGTWLMNNVEKGGNVFVYYSGHGAPNPQTGDAYLVPYDGDPTFIADTGYPLSRLYNNLARLPAKHIVVALDSCFSGAGGKSVLAKGARPLVMNMDKAQLVGKNIAVMTAASGDQISSSYEENGHGVFTYFFLKGIKEQFEQNKSAKLQIGQLFEYLKPRVASVSRKKYNVEQTPQLVLGSDSLRDIDLR